MMNPNVPEYYLKDIDQINESENLKNYFDSLNICNDSLNLSNPREKWILVCKLLEKFFINVQNNAIYIYWSKKDYQQIEKVVLTLNQLVGNKFHAIFSIVDNCWKISPESV